MIKVGITELFFFFLIKRHLGLVEGIWELATDKLEFEILALSFTVCSYVNHVAPEPQFLYTVVRIREHI